MIAAAGFVSVPAVHNDGTLPVTGRGPAVAVVDWAKATGAPINDNTAAAISVLISVSRRDGREGDDDLTAVGAGDQKPVRRHGIAVQRQRQVSQSGCR